MVRWVSRRIRGRSIYLQRRRLHGGNSNINNIRIHIFSEYIDEREGFLAV